MEDTNQFSLLLEAMQSMNDSLVCQEIKSEATNIKNEMNSSFGVRAKALRDFFTKVSNHDNSKVCYHIKVLCKERSETLKTFGEQNLKSNS